MSQASDYAAAYAEWISEKAALNAPYSDWYSRVGKTLPSRDVLSAWRESDEGKEYQKKWDEWARRSPEAPMYWVNPDGRENYIGVGDDGSLVFMPERDSGGETVPLEDMPKFRDWLRDVYEL